MKKLLLACLVGSLLLAASCSDDEDTITGGGEDHVIMPLVAGNTWWGTFTVYNTSGTPTGSSLFTFRFPGDTTMSVPGGTQQWMFQERTMGVITINTDDLYRYASDGCWGWFNYDGGASSPVMWAKYPASAGDMYMTGEYAGDTTTVVSTGTSVTVSAGTYTCHRYQIVIYRDDWRRVENYYLAPDVGYVKYEEYYRPAGGTEFLQSVWELDSLDLN